MQWDDVKVFLAVAKAGSLAAGARRLRLSQATVWRRMRALDEALGATLFERRPTGYVLTHQGTTFLRALEGVDSTIAVARRKLSEGADTVEGESRITVPEFLAPLLAERAAALARVHPRLRLELVSASPIADFGVRDADVTVRVERPSVGGFWISDSYPVRFAVYASTGYIERHGAPSALDDLAGHRLIDFDHSLAHAAPEPWRNADLSEAIVVLRCSSPHARRAAARTGLGLALLPHCIGSADESLREVLAPAVIGALEVLICIHTELVGQARIAASVEFLDQALRAAE
jgi:molybdate transport repressor ModE-like protein